jgi:hypothetical protein
MSAWVCGGKKLLTADVRGQALDDVSGQTLIRMVMQILSDEFMSFPAFLPCAVNRFF